MQFINHITHIVYFFIIFFVSVIGTFLLIRHTTIIDIPNERSSHLNNTPRGGGLAISLGFIIGLLVAQTFGKTVPISNIYFIGFFISALIISCLSYYDDMTEVNYKYKLLIQFFSVLLVISSGVIIEQIRFPYFGLVSLNWVSYPLTMIWILGLTNAYNFMDGLDGIAASTAVIASFFLAYIAYKQGSVFVYIISIALAASTLGFLVYNFPPAKIFMGDVGSTFLGFTFAVLAIIAALYDKSHLSLFVVPLLLYHFIFDTIVTFLLRLIYKEKVFQAHRRHVYQLLHRLGLTHLQVTLIYSMLAIFQGCLAIWMVNGLREGRQLIFLPIFILYSVLTYFVLSRARARKLI